MQPWPDPLLHILAEASPVESAKALLGCFLVAQDGLSARIVETEAYGGAEDLGSHACRGPKPKCASMFGPPGRAYVYLSYGCHWMLNVVCREEGVGSAVLIRAAEPLEGLQIMKARRGDVKTRDVLRGPGRLAKAFGLNRSHDGADLLSTESPLHLLPRTDALGSVLVSRRIGLSDGRGDDLPWRFVLEEGLKWASRGCPAP